MSASMAAAPPAAAVSPALSIPAPISSILPTWPRSTHLATGSANDLGFIGGGQVGCNYQSGAWVVGIEGDWDYFGSKSTFSNPNGTLTTGDTVTITQSLKTSSLATIRPRLGIVSDRTLIYVTGGAAFAKVSYTQSYADTLNNAVGAATTLDNDLVGWTVGAGWEWAWTDHVTVKTEYLLRQVSDHQRAGRDFGYRGRGQCSPWLRRSDDSDGPSRPELQVLIMSRPIKTESAVNGPAAIIRSTFSHPSQTHARHHDAATLCANPIGVTMSASNRHRSFADSAISGRGIEFRGFAASSRFSSSRWRP